MNNTLFIHGGPGASSLLETQLLGPVLEKSGRSPQFWNEPSVQRGTWGKEPLHFDDWLESAEKALLTQATAHGPVELIAHSFGAQAGIILAKRHPEALARLVLTSPAIDVWDVYRRVLLLAEQHLASSQPGPSRALRSCVEATRSLFDGPMKDGLAIAFQNPGFLVAYCHNDTIRQQWLEGFQVPGHSFDLAAFFSVSESLAHSTPSELLEGTITVPTISIFGAHDPVIDSQHQQSAARSHFTSLPWTVFANSAHYAHLEETENFVAALL